MVKVWRFLSQNVGFHSTLLTVNPAFTFVTDGGAITTCDVIASGDLSGCADAGVPASLLTTGEQLFVNCERNYLYVSNLDALLFSTPPVVRCALDDTTGVLSSCINAGCQLEMAIPMLPQVTPRRY
jgi:hypothetical protein